VRDIELPGLIHLHQLRRDGFRLRKAGVAHGAGVEILGDLLRIVATDGGAALLADEVELYVLARRGQLHRLGFRGLDEVGVEAAAQTLVGVDEDDEVALIRAGAGEELGRAVAGNLRREARHHRAQTLGIGTRGLGGRLRLA
jgi:hypothetical protein